MIARMVATTPQFPRSFRMAEPSVAVPEAGAPAESLGSAARHIPARARGIQAGWTHQAVGNIRKRYKTIRLASLTAARNRFT